MIDLWQVLLEQIMGGTNLYIPTILITMGIVGLCIANKRWMQMPKYMFVAVTSEMFGILFSYDPLYKHIWVKNCTKTRS